MPQPLEVWQSKEAFQGQSGAGGRPGTQLEKALELEGEERTLKAFQLLLQVATVAAAELVEMQDWEHGEMTPTLLYPAGRTLGTGRQRGGEWWKQVAWLGQKLTELLLGLAGTASGQRVGGAGEAA